MTPEKYIDLAGNHWTISSMRYHSRGEIVKRFMNGRSDYFLPASQIKGQLDFDGNLHERTVKTESVETSAKPTDNGQHPLQGHFLFTRRGDYSINIRGTKTPQAKEK